MNNYIKGLAIGLALNAGPAEAGGDQNQEKPASLRALDELDVPQTTASVLIQVMDRCRQDLTLAPSIHKWDTNGLEHREEIYGPAGVYDPTRLQVQLAEEITATLDASSHEEKLFPQFAEVIRRKLQTIEVKFSQLKGVVNHIGYGDTYPREDWTYDKYQNYITTFEGLNRDVALLTQGVYLKPTFRKMVESVQRNELEEVFANFSQPDRYIVCDEGFKTELLDGLAPWSPIEDSRNEQFYTPSIERRATEDFYTLSPERRAAYEQRLVQSLNQVETSLAAAAALTTDEAAFKALVLGSSN